MISLAATSAPNGKVKLSDGLFSSRAKANRRYVMSLDRAALLQNFYMEANLYTPPSPAHGGWDTAHTGWEHPSCPLRGHFLGHWLSAAAKLYAAEGDLEAKGRADWIVSELARCQSRNGGEWAGSIPEKYLHWIAQGVHVWAPQYTLHKTLMGLMDMYAFAGNREALDIADRWSNWFLRWTDAMTAEQLDDVLDVETGGMMEVWADLYAATGKPEHLELMNRYARRRLFEPLLRGEDVLTNMHANTTIPEIHGAARAYEVTGDARWRDVVEAYWRSAVVDRGSYCTGSQTAGEVWSAPGELSARLGERNQEHCVVYNMIRLADYLYRWSGEAEYLDYIERNLYNGILAQQHPHTGMVTYFLPLHAGAKKTWGSPTEHFWCCHGSLVQAHTLHAGLAYYLDGEGVVVAQYMPSEIRCESPSGRSIGWKLTVDEQTNWGIRDETKDSTRRPNRWAFHLEATADSGGETALKLRLPGWLQGDPQIRINGDTAEFSIDRGFATLRRDWKVGDRVHVALPKGLVAEALPDRSDTVAFLDGPIVLAGLVDEERGLIGDASRPSSLLVPDNEREWASWKPGYRTVGQDRGIRFIPLYEVVDQTYTVYFPVRTER